MSRQWEREFRKWESTEAGISCITSNEAGEVLVILTLRRRQAPRYEQHDIERATDSPVIFKRQTNGKNKNSEMGCVRL